MWDISHYNKIIKELKECVMKNFDVIAYTKLDGTVPVNEFLYTLSEKMRAKILKEFDMLADYGNELREPYTKYVGDGIFELRVKSGSDISRVMYFFYVGKRIILTNGFIKKTNKTPKCEIELARKYRRDYLSREEQ